MRLLHTRDLTLKDFNGTPPRYAILSHTWQDDEVLFADIANLGHARTKAGFLKMRQACQTAADDDLEWIWIDTCCVDKSSSAELNEALNSMFQWYEHSEVCYAYISDMLPDEELWHGLEKSRWVTRGWTLQELIAPKKVLFFDCDWRKRDGDGGICDITQIDPDVLYGRRRLSSVPISRRMSWAASRVTTRVEDRAYSLLGIFGVNMPMLYGEGTRAFVRLQQEIIKTTNDLSIFAWIPRNTQIFSALGWIQQSCVRIGLLAPGPELFTDSRPIERTGDSVFDDEFSTTNSGIKLANRLKVYMDVQRGQRVYFLRLGYRLLGERGLEEVGIDLCQCGPSMFSRLSRPKLSVYPYDDIGQTASGIRLFSQLQSPASDHIYIVAEPGFLTAQTVRKGAIIFRFVGDAQDYFTPDDIKAQPSTHYDRANYLFFTLERPGFVGLLGMPRFHYYSDHESISILCGLNDLSEPWCEVRKGADPTLHSTKMVGWAYDYGEVRGYNDKGEWLDFKLSVSIESGTLPGLGFEPEEQVHVVQVAIMLGEAGVPCGMVDSQQSMILQTR